MKTLTPRPPTLKDAVFHYCPGCGHSIAHRLVAEVIHEMGLTERTIGVPPAGCAVLAYNYFDVDMTEAPHGRGCAVATGIKRAMPESVVFTYQGDGDLAAIGTSEVIHAANRGERICVFFINNAVYGMTGGQMAPTTLMGMKTTTSPYGRGSHGEGAPIKVSELIGHFDGAVYVERCAVNSPRNIRKTKKAIRRAFQVQLDDLGFSLVEILSACPTNWKMKSVDSWKWMDEVMMKDFPLGIVKEPAAAEKDEAENTEDAG